MNNWTVSGIVRAIGPNQRPSAEPGELEIMVECLDKITEIAVEVRGKRAAKLTELTVGMVVMVSGPAVPARRDLPWGTLGMIATTVAWLPARGSEPGPAPAETAAPAPAPERPKRQRPADPPTPETVARAGSAWSPHAEPPAKSTGPSLRPPATAAAQAPAATNPTPPAVADNGCPF